MNVVIPEIVDAMVVASGDYPPEVDEIDLTHLTRVPSRRVRPPRIGESPVQMECRLEKLEEVAGTALILGRVLLYHVRDDLLEGGGVESLEAPARRTAGRRALFPPGGNLREAPAPLSRARRGA